MKEQNPVNVLYLTTECNFKCSYCYENQKENTYKKEMSNEDIKNAVDKIVNNKNNNILQHSICLFGGEPFLNINGIRFYMNYIKSSNINTLNGVSTNIITNGSLLHLYIDEIKEWIKPSNKNYFSLDISYDGSFQSRRTKSNVVEKNMLLLKNMKIPFGISYTITKDNMDSKIYTKDLLSIIKTYLLPKYDNRQRIRVNINNSDIADYDNFYKKIRYIGEYIFYKYDISICSFSCKYCKKCKFTNDSKQYFIPEKTSIVEKMVTNKKFNHF